MYLIDRHQNRIHQLKETSFSELGLRERDHLQEWIANYPQSLGEELLIIQKEFAGFSDTRERLDLLAVDKQGNLVIIENKLDDSGRDVLWQSQKYASYCSSLSKSQILKIYQEYLDRYATDENAEENLSEFFDGNDIEEIQLNQGNTQRVIMVAANFRKEVTSTVLWLLNYKLRIQCFKVTPHRLGDQILLNVEQVIPLREAEEYAIGIAEKTQEDIQNQEQLKSRHVIRLDFWKELLADMNTQTNLFQNISPGRYNWIGAGSGIRGVAFNFSISKNYVRCELYIDRGDEAENLFVFEQLHHRSQEIEQSFGDPLIWQRLESKRACRIKYEDTAINIFDRKCWPEAVVFLVDGMKRMEHALRPRLEEVNRKLKGTWQQDWNRSNGVESDVLEDG